MHHSLFKRFEKKRLLLFIAIPFFLATTFAVTPVSFFEKPAEERSFRSPDQHDSSHEEDSGDSSSIESRGRRLTAAEAAERDLVGRNEGINTASIIDNNDRLAENEFAMIDRARSNSEEYPSVIAAGVHQSQESFSEPHYFMPISSVATAILTTPLAHHFAENRALPIAAVHSLDYLNNLRSKLLLQHDSSDDDHQIIKKEMAVNQAALADGLSLEELRLLRAQETYEFFAPDFKAVQELVRSTSLHFDNLTRETTKISPDVWAKYLAAVQKQKEFFELLREAEQELGAALDAWKLKGGASVVAIVITDEENFQP